MTNAPSAAKSHRYKAFISYSHAADGKLAPALQAGLQRFTKPWYRLRAMRVFRDQTGLAVTPELWDSIARALEQSEYLVLLASPLAAASKWVQDEVAWWLENRTAERLLIVLTDGEIAWDEGASDFDWTRTDAFPRCLQKAYAGVPHFGDLRWVKSEIDVSLRRPRFLEEIARLTATLLHRPLDDIVGEDVAQHRTAMRMLRMAVIGLLVLTLAALGAAYVSFQAKRTADQLAAERQMRLDQQQREAEEQQEAQQRALNLRHREAASAELAAQAAAVLEQDPELSRLLALEAVGIAPTRAAEHALRQTLLGLVAPVVLQGHSQAVFNPQFSSDGQRVLTGSADGTVRLWDAASGTALLTLKVCEPGTGRAEGILDSDGRKVLTVVQPDSLAIGFWDEGQ